MKKFAVQTSHGSSADAYCLLSCASLPKQPASIFSERIQRKFSVRYNQFLLHLARRGTATDPLRTLVFSRNTRLQALALMVGVSISADTGLTLRNNALCTNKP